MSNSVIVPLDVIEEDELEEFVERIRKLTKAPVQIKRQFVLTSDSPSVMSGLKFLFEDVLTKPEYQNPPSRRNGHKPKKLAKESKEMTSHQVRLDGTGEILSRQAFNKKMAAGEIEELTNVTNAKGEAFVVMSGALVKGPRS